MDYCGFQLAYIFKFKLILCFVAVFLPAVTFAFADDLPGPPKRPHIVVDIKSGEVLSHELAFARWAPASLTKMMTAYTVFRTLQLQSITMDSPVRISEAAISQPPTKMGFPVGTILNIKTALKIIMVKSANDISVALAEATSGSEEQFVSLMNSHARRLGMFDSRFTNPHGLHDPNQYTSARDMALLTLQLTKEFPQYAGFFDIPAIRFGNRRLRNHNGLLRLFDGTNGMKTGYVCASGFNVAVRTKRGNRSLVAIVMGEKSGFRRNVKTAGLLQQGFENKSKNLVSFTDFKDQSFNSKQPYDITRDICPRKYAAAGRPKLRPPDAPSPQDFDGIDTQIIIPEGGFPVASLDWVVPPAPTKRPSVAKGIISVAVKSKKVVEKEEGSKQVVENKPVSFKELSKIYFAPVKNLRADVRINLGGGTGLNPYGIKHTNGDIYQAPIPVPIKRPALDLKPSRE